MARAAPFPWGGHNGPLPEGPSSPISKVSQAQSEDKTRKRVTSRLEQAGVLAALEDYSFHLNQNIPSKPKADSGILRNKRPGNIMDPPWLWK